jgi:hypothetical protein
MLDNGKPDAIIAMERCVADIRQWLTDDKLLMNDNKTGFVVITTKQQLSKIDIGSIKIGDDDGDVDIVPESPIRNLWAWFESTLSMDRHTTKSAFYYLYNIKRIRKFLSRADTETLIHGIGSSEHVFNEGDFIKAATSEVSSSLNSFIKGIFCACPV